jgi:CubicO group peptidase (beta-lactamase class C family)
MRTRPLVRLLPALALAAACGRAEPAGAPLPRCGAAPCDWRDLARTVDSAVADSAAPGVVVGVSIGGARYFHSAGRLGIDDPRQPDSSTVYDLASLTKVIALTTLAMQAVDEGRLDLDAPVDTYLPRFVGPGKHVVTIRHLLTHSSGLPAHRPLWREAPDRDSALALVLATPLDTVPGVRMVYSDLGAILLGKVVEGLYRAPLDLLAQDRIFGPLRMKDTRYRPPKSWLSRIAPTERDPWRGRIVHGEVHDENAAFLGGVSGHAGLFGSTRDLLTFGEWLMSRVRGDTTWGPRLPHPTTAQAFTRRQTLVPGSSRALGWDTPSPGSSAGNLLSDRSFGHTGFTGTSIWIDPTRALVIVLLSNRVHPTRNNPRLGPLRSLVADRVVEALEGSPH